MNREQLIEQYERLNRKLAMSTRTWHSGRIDCLAAALHAVERELWGQRPPAPATGRSPWRPVAAFEPAPRYCAAEGKRLCNCAPQAAHPQAYPAELHSGFGPA